MRYKSTGVDDLKYLTLSKTYLSQEDHWTINGRYYLGFDIDEECKIVSVCLRPIIDPVINRRVEIPTVPGVTSTPPAGIHYVASHTSFPFSLKFDGPTPLAVHTSRIIDGAPEPELQGRLNDNGEYEYVLRDVREDVYLQIGPDAASASADILSADIWSYNTTLYIKIEREDIASIYSIAGHLIKRIEVPAGTTAIPMENGVYIITLKDGSIHKVFIR
jgi:hypothetical protein